MRFLLLGIGALSLICFSVAVRHRSLKKKDERREDCIDGGVVKRYSADVPKVIGSSEILSFHCVASLLAVCEAGELGHRVYTLDAARADGVVLVGYSWYDRNGNKSKAESTADLSFMARLQEIVCEYDLARYNGSYHSVSGLPNMYGDTIDVRYLSDECIYAHDNQGGFLPLEAEAALVSLFREATNTQNDT